MKQGKQRLKLFVDKIEKIGDFKKFKKSEDKKEVGSQPCRSVSQGVGLASCLPKTAWPPTFRKEGCFIFERMQR